MPHFSVVIPMYNTAAFVGFTIASVLSQRFQDFEIVVVDDGSTDDSVRQVAAFCDARIKIIRKENTGVSDTRNAGAKAATGRYIAFLDSDDYWYPDHLSDAAEFFRSYPEVPWYAAGLFIQAEGTAPAQGRSSSAFRVLPFLGTGFQSAHSSTVIVDRLLFLGTRMFPVDMRQYEDMIGFLRIARLAPNIGTNGRQTCIYFRRSGSSSMRPQKNMFAVHERVVQMMAPVAAETVLRGSPLFKRHLVWMLKAGLFREPAAEMIGHLRSRNLAMGCWQRTGWRLCIAWSRGIERLEKESSARQKAALQVLRDAFEPSSMPVRFSMFRAQARALGVRRTLAWGVGLPLYAIRAMIDRVSYRMACLRCELIHGLPVWGGDGLGRVRARLAHTTRDPDPDADA